MEWVKSLISPAVVGIILLFIEYKTGWFSQNAPQRSNQDMPGENHPIDLVALGHTLSPFIASVIMIYIGLVWYPFLDGDSVCVFPIALAGLVVSPYVYSAKAASIWASLCLGSFFGVTILFLSVLMFPELIKPHSIEDVIQYVLFFGLLYGGVIGSLAYAYKKGSL